MYWFATIYRESIIIKPRPNNLCALMEKKMSFSPAGVAQLVGASSHTPKGWQIDPQSGHTPRLWVWSLVGAYTGGNWSTFLSHNDVCLSFFLFLSLSLSLSLSLYLSLFSAPPHCSSSLSKINKHILKWGLKRCYLCFTFKWPRKIIIAKWMLHGSKEHREDASKAFWNGYFTLQLHC